MGALSITGLPAHQAGLRAARTVHAPGTEHELYRRRRVPPVRTAPTPRQFGLWAADRIAEAIEFEGPDTVACVYLEPVQNSGGCFPPPPGYFQRVREICDRYDVLLVSDEVICAFGRLGEYFGAQRYGYQPDIITCAKGHDLRVHPAGRDDRVSDRLAEPFLKDTNWFAHGITFGGHPVASAVAMANLDIFEREDLTGHVRTNSPLFRSYLEKLTDLPIVGDVRGDGYFFGIETGQGQGDQGDVRRRRVGAAAARLPVQGAVRRRALLPRRRPRRPGDPARTAADLRRDALRRDRADPARACSPRPGHISSS